MGNLLSNLTPVVKNLLIINILFFVAQWALSDFMKNLELSTMVSEEFRPWQLATHFFMHANIPHLFFNMFALVIFGNHLERVWGPKRFLIFYMICALGAALIYLGWLYLEISQVETFINYYELNLLLRTQ